MDFENVDALYRSRKTLLKILSDKGYDTARYEKFGPYEIEMMASQSALSMTLQLDPAKRAAANALPNCRVEYFSRIKTRLNNYVSELINPEPDDDSAPDPATTELVILTLDQISANFHTAAATVYNATRLRVSFFCAMNMVNNPLEYSLVPKHEYVPRAEHETLLKGMNAEKKNLPIIRFHEDMIARILGLVPGDIVKITRPSPNSGVYITYRVCVA